VALKPVLRERQRETERNRRVSDATVTDIKSAGLYKVQQPARYGGYEFDIGTFVRCATEIGAGCGSTGWVYSTAAQHQWQIGMYNVAAQDEVWGDDPMAIAASSYSPGGTAVEVDGGYRITGKWLYCSGVLNADWMILGARIARDADSDPYTQGYILVPKTNYAVEDNWDVMGLIGTGSNDVIVEDLFIPAHRMLTLEQALSGKPPGSAVNGNDLWKVPFFCSHFSLSVRCSDGHGEGRTGDLYRADSSPQNPWRSSEYASKHGGFSNYPSSCRRSSGGD
jgi:alkylation response protein AidB-like acyl-CoA dehydrogenase